MKKCAGADACAGAKIGVWVGVPHTKYQNVCDVRAENLRTLTELSQVRQGSWILDLRALLEHRS